MTEQELLDEIQSNAGTYEDFTARTTAIFASAKAYATAQVADTKEILVAAENEVDYLREMVKAKDAEIARLESAYKALATLPTLTYESDSDEVKALKAENARMREADTRMRKALIDIEDDAHAKAAAGLPLNVHSTLMSARYGLGIDSELLSPADGDGVEEAKYLEIDEMKEYCIGWCQSLNLGKGESRKLANGLGILEMSSVYPPMAWVFNGCVRIAKHPDYCSRGFIVEAYAIIRAIERGDLGMAERGIGG